VSVARRALLVAPFVSIRSLTGEGNFNWRFVFNFNYLEIEEKIVFEKKDSLFQVGHITKKLPPRLVIRVYDADLLAADDFLGGPSSSLSLPRVHRLLRSSRRVHSQHDASTGRREDGAEVQGGHSAQL
jgi:hypothetical protein